MDFADEVNSEKFVVIVQEICIVFIGNPKWNPQTRSIFDKILTEHAICTGWDWDVGQISSRKI